MSVGVSCSLQVLSMVDAIEAGSQLFPIFFDRRDCSSGQYPPQGETFDNTHINTGPFNLRALACLDAAGQPADPLIGNLPSGTPDTTQCPLNPTISAMLLPPGLSVTFYAPTQSKTNWIQQSVKDPGSIVISSSQASTNNFLIFPRAPGANSGFTWGSGSGGANCNHDTTNTDQYFDASGLMKYSSISCGARFYPSLYTFPATYNDNTKLCKSQIQEGQFPSPGAMARVACPPTVVDVFGACAYGMQPAVGKCNDPNPPPPTGWTAGDVIAPKSEFNFSTGAPHEKFYKHLCNSDSLDSSNCANDPLKYGTNGTVQNVAFTYENGDWSSTQFLACTGQFTLSIGTIKIQRYGQSTPACDDVVPQYCQNSAFLSVYPFAAKACSCINEQKRINLQFAGLDMPVQCFSDVCSNNDPHVYRTSAQSQGCSAKICSQIISINGTAISSQGQQTLTCDSVVYDLSSPDVSITPIPIVTVPDIPGPNLDVTFYLALGLMVCMVILLVVWGIRQAVLSKRNKKQQNDEITHALEKILTPSTNESITLQGTNG